MLDLNGEISKLITQFNQASSGPSSSTLRRLQTFKYDEAELNSSTSILFDELVNTFHNKGAVRKWAAVDVIVKIGTVVIDENAKGQDFWLKLLNLKISRKAEFDPHLLETLLLKALDDSRTYAWKCFALLLKFFYSKKEDENSLITQLLAKYASSLGQLLDTTHDFQLANYVVELLVNVFPRRHIDTTTVPLFPKLWKDQGRNKAFFGDVNFPSTAKYGESPLMEFVARKLGPFDLLGHLKAVYCGPLNGKDKKKLFSGPGYAQSIQGMLHIWGGNGLFLQLRLQGLDIIMDPKHTLKLTVLEPFEDVASSLDSQWLERLKRPQCFYIEFSERELCENILRASRARKISEVKSFISLNFESSSEADAISSATPLNNLSERHVIEEQHVEQSAENITFEERNENNTPSSFRGEPCLKVRPDEWDINPSSRSLSLRGRQNSPPDGGPHYDDFSEFEKSPLVMAQRRKRMRENSKILENKKKGTLNNNSQQLSLKDKKSKRSNTKKVDSSSIEILKPFEVINSNAPAPLKNRAAAKEIEVAKPAKVRKIPNGDAIHTSKVTAATSIKKKDISALENIFGNAQKDRKRQKQQTLSKFRKMLPSPVKDRINPAQQPSYENCHNDQLDRTPSKEKTKFDEDQLIEQAAKRKTRSQKLLLASSRGSNKKVTKPDKKLTKSKPLEVLPSSTGLPSDESLKAVRITDAAESTSLEATTMVSLGPQLPMQSTNLLGSSFTTKLQEQIFSSITNFSNELAKKITIINEELNNKICQELSEKYQRMFDELQSSFQNDVEQMSHFVGEIRELLHLSEDQLIEVIREKQFH